MQVFVSYSYSYEDLRGRNVLHYHPFTLLRDCSISAPTPFVCHSNEPLSDYFFSILPLCRLSHLAEEGDQEVVSEIVWDIVDVAWEQVYHNWVQNEIFPYAVEDARQKLLQSIAVRSNAHRV